jgi:hypothetical protein
MLAVDGRGFRLYAAWQVLLFVPVRALHPIIVNLRRSCIFRAALFTRASPPVGLHFFEATQVLAVVDHRLVLCRHGVGSWGSLREKSPW